MKWLWLQSARWTLLSALLRERAVVYWLLGFTFVYLLFSFFEISIWRCAWRMVTGLRCPGCGLTTGCKAFLRGDFAEGFAWNWFTPAVMLGLLIFPVVIALPKAVRGRFIDRLELFESRFRIVVLFLLAVVIQTIARFQGWA